MAQWHFYALIIGTEILNARRQDAHFTFVRDALIKRGYSLHGSFIIADDPTLITRTIRFIAQDTKSILLSFGGIGSTPDDHTRLCAAKALGDGKLYEHPEAKRIIKNTLGKRAYPHPIKMAQLPKGATLLHNPVNNMPAFSLEGRFFFLPGFAQMSHPMVEQILDTLVPIKRVLYRKTLTAFCRENEFIELMEQAPRNLEVSSLPKISAQGWEAVLSVAGEDKDEVERYFRRFCQMLQAKRIVYRIEDRS